MDTIAYKLLLLDLDGTLIGKDSAISPRVAEAVRTVSDRLQVSIVTGREKEDVLRFAGELGLTAPQVSDNGALVLDPCNGNILWSWPLGTDYAREIIGRLDQQGTAFIATHPGGTATSFDEVTDWDINRVSAMDIEEEQADRLAVHYESEPGLNVVKVYLPYNGLWAVDFTRVGVNKAAASRKLADLAGVGDGKIIAAGDSYNDLDMLKISDLRIAMAEAPPELKAIADYVAPSVDDDGLAVAIEEFVIPRLGAGGVQDERHR